MGFWLRGRSVYDGGRSVYDGGRSVYDEGRSVYDGGGGPLQSGSVALPVIRRGMILPWSFTKRRRSLTSL